MSFPTNIPSGNGSESNLTADAVLEKLDSTLRLLAKLPAPAGLEGRVFAGVLAAPRKSAVLEWPRPLYARDWVRSIAATAIVLAVGGGGWGIYEHVEPKAPSRAIVAPRTVFQPGGFSSAEMIRRPQTLNGPVVKKAETGTATKTDAAKHATEKKPAQAANPRGRHHAEKQPARTNSDPAK